MFFAIERIEKKIDNGPPEAAPEVALALTPIRRGTKRLVWQAPNQRVNKLVECYQYVEDVGTHGRIVEMW